MHNFLLLFILATDKALDAGKAFYGNIYGAIKEIQYKRMKTLRGTRLFRNLTNINDIIKKSKQRKAMRKRQQGLPDEETEYSRVTTPTNLKTETYSEKGKSVYVGYNQMDNLGGFVKNKESYIDKKKLKASVARVSLKKDLD